MVESFPPGVVGVATATMGRYRSFDKCLYKTDIPIGTHISWQEGNHIATNFNKMVHVMLSDDKYQWLWILGDDHVWQPGLLRALLERDVDCVVPLCLHKCPPFTPVIHSSRDDDYQQLDYEWLAGKSGLIKLNGEVPGNAGLLVKRHVVERLDPPWFEDGKTDPEMGGCDLWFIQKLIDIGVDIYFDTANRIGHLQYAAVWPGCPPEGELCSPVIKMAGDTYVDGREVSNVAVKRDDFEAIDGLS